VLHLLGAELNGILLTGFEGSVDESVVKKRRGVVEGHAELGHEHGLVALVTQGVEVLGNTLLKVYNRRKV